MRAPENLINDVNDSILLHLIRERGSIARRDLAKLTRLNPSTITRITNRLIQAGFLRESGQGDKDKQKVGRKPVLLEINPRGGYLVGMDIGAWKIKVVIVDLTLQPLYRLSVLTQPRGEKDSILDRAFLLMERAIDKCGIEKEKIKGIGIGISGSVDNVRGICSFAPNLDGWRDVPVKDLFEKKFKIQTFVTNCMTVMALGEKYYGEAKETHLRDLICINLGEGIGSGIILQDELLLSSATKHVGNIGHMTVEKGGPVCGCGKRGCLEAIAGGRALARQAVEAVKKGVPTLIKDLVKGDTEKISAETVAKAAQMGDTLALNLLGRAGRHIGSVVAILMQLYYPEKIILGGGLIKAGEPLLDPLIETIKEWIVEEELKKVEITTSKLGEYAGALGATRLVSHEVFKTPLLHLIRRA